MEKTIDRLKQAVHYICHVATEQSLDLGSIRLNKILFFSDREYYSKHYKALTQDAYVKGPQGPYQPDVADAVEELKNNRILSVTQEMRHGKKFTVYLSKRPPDMTFSKEEYELLEKWTIEICHDYKSHEISEFTHNSAWRMASKQESIPLAAQMLGLYCPPTQADWDWAEKAFAQ